MYMRKISAAKSEASSPPVPARISRIDVLLVVGILGQQQHLELFFDRGFGAGLECGDLFLGHGAQVGIGLGQHGARFGEALLHLLQFAILLHRLFDLAERLGGLLIFLVVVDDLGQRELRLQVVVALLHLFQAINHCAPPGVSGLRVNKLGMGKSAEQCRRRAPLEEGRDGLMEVHDVSILPRSRRMTSGLTRPGHPAPTCALGSEAIDVIAGVHQAELAGLSRATGRSRW